MICGFCGRDIPDEIEAQSSCGLCGSGCRYVHCPWCGYKNPLPTGLLKRLMRKKAAESKEPS